MMTRIDTRHCEGRPGTAGRLRRFACVFFAAVCLAAAQSCSVRRERIASPVEPPPAFSESGPAAMPLEWWRAFGDDKLDALVEEALAENFQLQIAWDRLEEARARARREGADLWPSLDFAASASRTVRETDGAGRSYATDLGLTLAAGYEVDLWGRIGASRDAAVLDAEASREDLDAAAVSLSAEVALAWYRIIERRRQLDLLDEQVATNEKYLQVITAKFRQGQVPASDVLQQRQLVESTNGEKSLVLANLETLEHRLAVLAGRAPGLFEAPEARELAGLPPAPRTGIPAGFVRVRPDVRAAERRVEAADRRVAEAIAERFPRLVLSGTADTSAEEIEDLFDNWLASIAAAFTAPLIDGGRRRAEVERREAVLSERLNAYGQTVLEAFREVEDALSDERRRGEYVASLARQLDLSQRAVEEIRQNYILGTTTDFTRYLTALLSHQRLQRSYLDARLGLLVARVGLYRSLAGGWQLERIKSAGDAPRGSEAEGAGEDDSINDS